MLKLFLRFQFSKARKYFRTRATAKAITALLFVAVLVFLGMGIYGFSLSGFRYIYFGVEETFRAPLSLFIYEAFLLILAGLIIASAMVSGVFSLFRGGNDAWFISTPGYRVFPKLIFIKSMLVSIWPLIIMFFPVILALEKMYSLGLGSIVLITAGIVLLLLLANTLTLSIVIVLGYVYFIFSRIFKFIRFRFAGFVALLLIAIAANLAYVWRAVAELDLVSMFKADNADAVVTVSNIGSYFASFPTHELAMQIISLQIGDWGAALSHAWTFLAVTLIAVLAWWLVSPLYYPLWQGFQEGRGQNIDKNSRSGISYRFKGGLLSALFKKELLVASRDWKGVLWFSFLTLIWLIQIGGSLIMEHNIRRHEVNIEATMATLQTIQFVIAAYFICAFTLRFVFPSFSVEKKTAWILGTAPIQMTKLFFGKYLFYGSVFVSLGLLMNYINATILNVSVAQALYSTVLLSVTIISVVTFGMMLGALFPNKESDDPEVISTSMSGLFFTAVSLLYGGLGAWTLKQALVASNLAYLEAFVAISLALVAFALFLVPRFMRRTIFD